MIELKHGQDWHPGYLAQVRPLPLPHPNLNGSAWNQETPQLGLNLGLNQIPIFRGGAEKFMFKPSDLKREKKKKRGNNEERKKTTTRLSRIWRISEDSLGLLPSL